jgi:hypothetical protein
LNKQESGIFIHVSAYICHNFENTYESDQNNYRWIFYVKFTAKKSYKVIVLPSGKGEGNAAIRAFVIS